MPEIVGFVGRAGSGKTLAADLLCSEFNFVKVKFAKPIKEMLISIGLTEDHIEGELKEKPCDLLCGMTPRWAMQTLGTEWGRSLIGENMWGNLWENKVRQLLDMNQNVVVDDIRFMNELKRVRTLNARVIGLLRNEKQDVTHSSEQIDMKWCDHVLFNEKWSPEQLCDAVRFLASSAFSSSSS